MSNARMITKSLLNNMAHRAGGAVISSREYHELQQQKVNLLKYAADGYRPQLNQKETIGLVFSFNRPVQLFALLESYFQHAKNPTPLVIQYGASNADAKKGYAEVEALMKNNPVTFVEETNCQETLLEILGNTKAGKIFFLVDDILFIRPVDMAQFTAIDPQEYVPSLRLAPHLNYSYTMQVPQLPPKLLESDIHTGMLTWKWGDETNEWYYPFSVDGHLFDTAEIVMMARSAPFKAPNTFEGLLHGFRMVAQNRAGLCYLQAVQFNNPCNKVQNENDNVAGLGESLSLADLMKRWNAGEKIDTAALANFNNTGTHQEVAFTFIKR